MFFQHLKVAVQKKAAFSYEKNPVCQRLYILRVMGGKDNGGALVPVDFPDNIADRNF